MEEVYQEYKDSVNFVWVYGSEAHPSEHPFQEGYESTDLGWTHPYNISIKMAERAERAAWMKSDPDPDFEIPMMIDYINYPEHTDNAIRSAYRGSGFYSAFIIDCDGAILQRHTWGWFGTGGEWWGLPLESVDNLRSFLNSYLANPPACYTGTAINPVDGDNDTDIDNTPSDGDLEIGTPILDSSHKGWKAQQCATCHSLPVQYHLTSHQSDCAGCHGGNGACEPVQTKHEHAISDSCMVCHAKKHNYQANTDCVSCHYAFAGTTICENDFGIISDGDVEKSQGDTTDADIGDNDKEEVITTDGGCQKTDTSRSGNFLLGIFLVAFALIKTRRRNLCH